MIYLVNKMV